MSRQRCYRLANGLRVVFVAAPHLHTVAFSAVIRLGSRQEDGQSFGLTHFLEHMLFRGSHGFSSPQAQVAPFERAGGTLSAETWRDHTHFFSTIHPSGLLPCLTALGDLLSRPLWQDIEAERTLVQAELLADLDVELDANGQPLTDGDDADLTNLSRAAIWRNHPMGRRITGSLARLGAFTKKDLSRHHGRHYHAGNVVLALAGPVDAQALLPHLEAAFAHLPAAAKLHGGSQPTLGRATGRPPQFAPTGRMLYRDVATNQVALQLSYEAPADTHPDFVVLQLLTNILDDGMGTRLHRALSEDSGLVYTFHTGLDCYHDVGLYELEMHVAPQRTLPALRCALATLERVATHGVTQQELTAACARAQLAQEMGADSVDELAYEAGLDALFSRPPAATGALLRAQVRPADVQRLAEQLFVSGRRHLTMMGPSSHVDRLGVARLLRSRAAAARPAPVPKIRSQALVAAGRAKKPRRRPGPQRP